MLTLNDKPAALLALSALNARDRALPAAMLGKRAGEGGDEGARHPYLGAAAGLAAGLAAPMAFQPLYAKHMMNESPVARAEAEAMMAAQGLDPDHLYIAGEGRAPLAGLKERLDAARYVLGEDIPDIAAQRHPGLERARAGHEARRSGPDGKAVERSRKFRLRAIDNVEKAFKPLIEGSKSDNASIRVPKEMVDGDKWLAAVLEPVMKPYVALDGVTAGKGILAHEIGHMTGSVPNAVWGSLSHAAHLPGFLGGAALASAAPSENASLAAGAAGSALSLPVLIEELRASARGLKMGGGKASFIGIPTYAASTAGPMLAYLARKMTGGFDKTSGQLSDARRVLRKVRGKAPVEPRSDTPMPQPGQAGAAESTTR